VDADSSAAWLCHSVSRGEATCGFLRGAPPPRPARSLGLSMAVWTHFFGLSFHKLTRGGGQDALGADVVVAEVASPSSSAEKAPEPAARGFKLASEPVTVTFHHPELVSERKRLAAGRIELGL
jgi:hypothetical protein